MTLQHPIESADGRAKAPRPIRDISRVLSGLQLIGIGVLLLIGQLLGASVVGSLWPLFVIAFGWAFFAGMFAGGKETGPLAIPGSMFVILGLILLVHTIFDLWSTWSYAWALFAPTGVGIGLIIQSWWSDIPKLKREGYAVTAVGLALFISFGAFFEIVIGINATRPWIAAMWPIGLIGLGVALLLVRLIEGRALLTLLPPHYTRNGTPIDAPGGAVATGGV